MPLDFFKFFDPVRLFSLRPAIAISTIYFLLAIFIAMVLGAVVLKIIQKKINKDAFVKMLLQKYQLLLLVTGLAGIVLSWFRYERVYIFSGRFWLLIWFIWFASWLSMILYYQFRVIPARRLELSKTREFNKYLPKKK